MIGSAYPGHRRVRSGLLKGTGEGASNLTRAAHPLGRENLLWSKMLSVPQTDTGNRGENPQACEITTAKELGKMTP